MSIDIKIFNLLITCYDNSLQLISFMLFAIDFVFMFIVEKLNDVVLVNASLMLLLSQHLLKLIVMSRKINDYSNSFAN